MKMEAVGAISKGEWNTTTYGGIYSSSTNEEADFMAQLFVDNCSLPNENPNGSTFLASSWPVHAPTMEIASMEETSMYSSNNNSSDDNTNNNNNDNDVTNNMFYYFSQSSSYSGDNGIIYPRSDESYVFEGGNNNNSKDDNFMESGDNFLIQELSNDNNSMEYSHEKKGDDDVHHHHHHHHQNGFLGINLQLGMEHDDEVVPLQESSLAEDEKVMMRCPKDNVANKKRPPPHGYKNKRSVKAKKKQRGALSSGNIGDEENDINNSTPTHQIQNSTMSYCSEDDTNASLESNGGGTTSSSTSKRGGASNQTSGKTRASRGSATDPQSLYARKRREKINERLKILQNLVPNGTKVDISTMLEEAVQYVKFLQLQIKLLSSDDLWMYSPIAYNGMDMGLDLKIASHNL